MALATLCHVLRVGLWHAHNTFQALVVDHKAREGSGSEARNVVSKLSALG